MSNLVRIKAAMRLARELHISFKNAEKVFDTMLQLKRQISKAQKEAAAMVDEMMD